MTTLAKDTPRNYGQGIMNDLPVIASDIIYEGAMVGENASGYSRPLVAGDPFQGVCVRQADNSTGNAGDIDVRVKASGILSNMAVTGAAAVTMNDFPPVYASDDGTLTVTAGGNSLVGNVLRWISAAVCDVSFSTPRPPSTVGTGDLEAEAVTVDKMEDLAQGSLWSGQAADRPAELAAETDAQILIGDGTDLNSVAMSGDTTIDNAGVVTIGADKVDLAMLNSGILPSHIIVYGGTETTTGGNVTEAHSVAGIVAVTDFVSVTVREDGTNTVTINQVAITDDTITITFSGDPGNDLVYNYLIFRAAA